MDLLLSPLCDEGQPMQEIQQVELHKVDQHHKGDFSLRSTIWSNVIECANLVACGIGTLFAEDFLFERFLHCDLCILDPLQMGQSGCLG